MYSAGVNAALAQFFGIADAEASNTPLASGNIPNDAGNIPVKRVSTIPNNLSNILGNTPSRTLIGEVMPGK
jgi:hypothetical protein